METPKNSSVIMADIVAFAQSWALKDPDPKSRDELLAMIQRNDLDALRTCFTGRLEFGTAGMRGPLKPGPNGMNRVMVRWVTAGLAQYLKASQSMDITGSVVIGYDGRHGSFDFARDAAMVLASHGFQVLIHTHVVPTPELAHAVTELNAQAGIMVTASHNPPGDNGYKVYWSNGAQIIPPHDRGISVAIDSLGGPPAEVMDYDQAVARGQISEVPAEVGETYVERVLALRTREPGSLKVVYTPMHGVGGQRMIQILSRGGYSDVHLVPEQAEPDPDFSTVAFPNPEEPGALALAKALATRMGAELIIANDPDADRLAACIPSISGGWRQLSGNELGVLFAVERLKSLPPEELSRSLVATTIVSTPLLARIAEDMGVHHTETLTGFKWIANKAIEWDAKGGSFVMGFEEALGYCIGSVVRDKDGLSAALVLCDLAASCAARGLTLQDELDTLHRKYGVYASGQKSLTLPGADGRQIMDSMMNSLRTVPPKEVLGLPVVRIRDAQCGTISFPAEGRIEPWDIPESNVLGWELSNGTTLLARPSGTEPKIKFYAYVCEPFKDGDTIARLHSRADERVSQILAALLTRVGDS